MDKKIQKIIPLSLGVLVLSLFAAYLLHATWTEPTGAPPAGNPVLGDRLYVYKNDGVTRLGVLIRRHIGDRIAGFHCGWGFALPTGGIHWLGDTDRKDAYGSGTLFFRNAGCTGRVGFSGGRAGQLSCCWHTALVENNDTFWRCTSGGGTVTWNSRRVDGGECEDITFTGGWRECSPVSVGNNFVCGDGPCIIK